MQPTNDGQCPDDSPDSSVDQSNKVRNSIISTGVRFSLRPTVGDVTSQDKQSRQDPILEGAESNAVPSISSFQTRSREINQSELPVQDRLDEMNDDYVSPSGHSLPSLPQPTVDQDEEEEPSIMYSIRPPLPPQRVYSQLPAVPPVPSVEQVANHSLGFVRVVASALLIQITVTITCMAFFSLTRSSPIMYTTNENEQAEYILLKPYVATGASVNGKPTPSKMVLFEPEQQRLLNGTSLLGGHSSIYNTLAFVSVFGTVFDVTSYLTKQHNSPLIEVLGKEASSSFAGIREDCDQSTADDSGLITAYEWYLYLQKLENVGTMGVLHGNFYDATGRATSSQRRQDTTLAIALDNVHKHSSLQSRSKVVNSPEQGGYQLHNHACKTQFSPRKGGMAFCEQYVPKIRRGWHVDKQLEKTREMQQNRHKQPSVHVAGMSRLRAQQRGDYRSQSTLNTRYNVSEHDVILGLEDGVEENVEPQKETGQTLDPVWYPRDVLIIVVDQSGLFSILLEDADFKQWVEEMHTETEGQVGETPESIDLIEQVLLEEEQKTHFYTTLRTRPATQRVRSVLHAVLYHIPAPPNKTAQVKKARSAVREESQGCECVTRAQEESIENDDQNQQSYALQGKDSKASISKSTKQSIFKTFNDPSTTISDPPFVAIGMNGAPLRAKQGPVNSLYSSKRQLKEKKLRSRIHHASGKQQDGYWRSLHALKDVEHEIQHRVVNMEDSLENIRYGTIEADYSAGTEAMPVRMSTFSDKIGTDDNKVHKDSNTCKTHAWPGSVNMNTYMHTGAIVKQVMQSDSLKQGKLAPKIVKIQKVTVLPHCTPDAVVCAVDAPSQTNTQHTPGNVQDDTPSWRRGAKKNKV